MSSVALIDVARVGPRLTKAVWLRLLHVTVAKLDYDVLITALATRQ